MEKKKLHIDVKMQNKVWMKCYKEKAQVQSNRGVQHKTTYIKPFQCSHEFKETKYHKITNKFSFVHTIDQLPPSHVTQHSLSLLNFTGMEAPSL